MRNCVNDFMLLKLHLVRHVSHDVSVHLLVPRVVREEDRDHGTIIALPEPLVTERFFKRYALLAVKREKPLDQVFTC